MPNTKGVTTSPPVIKNLDLTGHGKLVKEIFFSEFVEQMCQLQTFALNLVIYISKF